MAELKFAVVREDPQIEESIVKRAEAENILLVGSGGCTALHLKHVLPSLEVVAYDFNPTQLAHIEHKNEAVAQGKLALLNVEDDNPAGLNQCGAFEGLFRVLRRAFEEWVAPASALCAFFDEPNPGKRIDVAKAWISSRYWKSVFASAFHDELLNAMFGPAATQHAPSGSYPGYFQGVFEDGLTRPRAHLNPFLQHVLLGYYTAEAAPSYTGAGQRQELELREGALTELTDIARFDVVHLSNIFDWSDDGLVAAWAQHLEALRPGAHLITRQLNNTRDLGRFLGGHFVLDVARSEGLQRHDQSLFYNQVGVWQRRG